MEKIQVIAEIAGGHMGKIDQCLQLVDAAGKAKADAIKFQFYKADELCEKNHPDYAIFKSLEFSFNDWQKIVAAARSYGMVLYGDIFGEESFQEACSLDIDGFKLHSADLDNLILIHRLVQVQKNILLGIGGRRRGEIYQTVKTIRNLSKTIPLILIPGHQLFPTPIEEHSLDEIRWFAAVYADLCIQIGCADHIDGDDPLALSYPVAAVGAGAKVIEKHLTIDRSQKWEDYESAIEPQNFFQLVDTIRAFDKTLSFPLWSQGRQQYREKAVKTYFTASKLEKEEVLNEKNVHFLRPSTFCEPLASRYSLGRPVLQEIKPDSMLNGNDVKQQIGILVNARTASTRLPQKALKKMAGKETVALLLERMRHCQHTQPVVLCTTEETEDDILVEIGKREGVEIFRGPSENVAARLLLAAQTYELDHIVRVTGDDLMRDMNLIDQAVESHLAHNADYTYMKGVVASCDSEVISVCALETVVERAVFPENTEYLTWYLDDESVFVQNYIEAPPEYWRDYRLTLDTIEDFHVLDAIYEALYHPPEPIDLLDALHWLDQHPEIARLNVGIPMKYSREDLDVRMKI